MCWWLPYHISMKILIGMTNNVISVRTSVLKKKPAKFVAGHVAMVAIISLRWGTRNLEQESPPSFTEYYNIWLSHLCFPQNATWTGWCSPTGIWGLRLWQLQKFKMWFSGLSHHVILQMVTITLGKTAAFGFRNRLPTRLYIIIIQRPTI